MSQTAYEPVPAVEPAEPRPSAGTVVMKFGGTSVGDVERLLDVARRIVAAREAGNRVVGVLSAMGDQTDELLDLAHRISTAPKPRALDMLVSVGERITCSLAEMAIEDFGHPAISLTGSQAGIVTDTVHGKAKIVEIRAHRIHEALDEDHIVLVAGFQGVSTDYEVTTLGRGGSDMTAVALAAALGADACEIYTDVEGVFTADPRVVPEARKLHAVSYEEMLEMAASGAKVLQLRSVEFARNHGVKVHVRSTFSGEDGTWIAEEDERMLEKAMISGVTHTREESLYTVGGIGAGRAVRRARGRQRQRRHDRPHRRGHRVLGARRGPRRDRRRPRRPRRRHVVGARRSRQGERDRRRNEEPPRDRRAHVRDARRARARRSRRDHLADQDRLLRRPGRGRARRSRRCTTPSSSTRRSRSGPHA